MAYKINRRPRDDSDDENRMRRWSSGDGGVYNGQFKNDEFHGNGRFEWDNGEYEKGQYRHGEFWSGKTKRSENRDNSTSGENAYGNQLQEITDKLIKYNHGRAKLQYATTTPLMSDYNTGNYVVEEDNKIAQNMMHNLSIPIVPLYQTVVDVCGPVPYVNCSICGKSPCSFHYNSEGYQDLSIPVINEIRKQLNIT
eukprot:468922_1